MPRQCCVGSIGAGEATRTGVARRLLLHYCAVSSGYVFAEEKWHPMYQREKSWMSVKCHGRKLAVEN